MRHQVVYKLIEVDSQSTVADVHCTACHKNAIAYDKHFMRTLTEADDCQPSENPDCKCHTKEWEAE